MKRLHFYILLSAAFTAFNACKKQEALPHGEGVAGSWVVQDSREAAPGEWVTSYQRTAGLQDDAHGYLFKDNGELISRQIAYCPVPPALYIDYNGSWTMDGDTLRVRQESLTGEVEVRMLVVSVNNTLLQIKTLEESQI